MIVIAAMSHGDETPDYIGSTVVCCQCVLGVTTMQIDGLKGMTDNRKFDCVVSVSVFLCSQKGLSNDAAMVLKGGNVAHCIVSWKLFFTSVSVALNNPHNSTHSK